MSRRKADMQPQAKEKRQRGTQRNNETWPPVNRDTIRRNTKLLFFLSDSSFEVALSFRLFSVIRKNGSTLIAE